MIRAVSSLHSGQKQPNPILLIPFLYYGARIKVRPGQTLAADIELDRRRLIEWMFDPLYALGKRI